ncbi:HNH/ENDO VII family nuclease, partial [Ectopseudomonas guguanensis]
LQESGLFSYSLSERFNDAVSSRGEGLYYTSAAGSVIGGAGGAIVSGVGGAGACTVSFGVGCALGAAGVVGGISEYSDGLDRISNGYTSTEGQKVIDSFRPGTHQGDVSLAGNMGDFVVSAAADLVLQRVGGKVVDRVAKAVDGKLNVPKTDSGAVGGNGAKGTAADAGSVFSQQRNFWSKDPIQFNGNKVYQRDDLFEPNLISSWREGGKVVTGTNLERMASGRAPIGVDGKSVNLHHTTQTQSWPIAEMTQTFHQQNSSVIHVNPNTIPSGIDRAAFDKWKTQYWQQRAAGYGGAQ